MINRLISLMGIKNIDKRRVAKNTIFLYIVQGTNYILPLITFPYLVRVLGPEKFGLVAFAQAFVQYFIVVTDYGFSYSAPKRVAVNQTDDDKLSDIFSSIMMIKVILLVMSFMISSFFILTFSKFRNDSLVYFATFAMVIGNIFSPVWFFQGIERMKYITLLNLFSKIFFTLAIFIFIKDQNDYIYVPVLNSLGSILAGAFGFWIIIKLFNVKIRLPSRSSMYEELKEGRHIFFGISAVSLYSTSNTFILGLFANNTVVGYFKAGDTIVRGLISLISPISQAIYPYASRMAHLSKVNAIGLLKKVLIIFGGGSLILAIALFLLSRQIVSIVLGPQYTDAVIVLRILSPLIFFMVVSNILAIQGLLAFNMNKAFSLLSVLTGVINIPLALILAPTYKHIGISISFLITEIFAAVAVFLYLKQKDFFIKQERKL